jgi:hypothetical protein
VKASLIHQEGSFEDLPHWNKNTATAKTKSNFTFRPAAQMYQTGPRAN